MVRRFQALFFFSIIGLTNAFAAHAAPSVTLGAHGIGKVAVLSLPRGAVEALLPEGLELAENADLPANQASISILFVKHVNLKVLKPVGPVIVSPGYKELILGVNGVHRHGENRSYWYFKKLYLDSWSAVVGGWYLAYPKWIGVLDFRPGLLKAETQHGSFLASFQFWEDARYDKAEFARNFEKVKRTLMAPVIEKGVGGWVCSQFSWDFAMAKARPIDIITQVGNELNPAVSGWYVSRGLNSAGIGGYSLESDWTVVGPISCD